MHGLNQSEMRLSDSPRLVSTRRGTVRIQNTDPRPKTSSAPLSAPRQPPVCYVRSRRVSIIPQEAGVAKQPRCIMKRNMRVEMQNSQRVKMLRDEKERSWTRVRPSNLPTAGAPRLDRSRIQLVYCYEPSVSNCAYLWYN